MSESLGLRDLTRHASPFTIQLVYQLLKIFHVSWWNFHPNLSFLTWYHLSIAFCYGALCCMKQWCLYARSSLSDNTILNLKRLKIFDKWNACTRELFSGRDAAKNNWWLYECELKLGKITWLQKLDFFSFKEDFQFGWLGQQRYLYFQEGFHIDAHFKEPQQVMNLSILLGRKFGRISPLG